MEENTRQEAETIRRISAAHDAALKDAYERGVREAEAEVRVERIIERVRVPDCDVPAEALRLLNEAAE